MYSKSIVVGGAFLILIAVFNKEGYYHSDEHYQILEWASSQLKHNDYERLPWEFNEQIRPNFQTVICKITISLSELFGVSNPHVISLIIRLLAALVSFLALLSMYRLLSKIYKEIRPWIIASCTFLFWCVPVLSVRFSSEILGGAFLCIAICRILDTDKKKIWNHLIIGSLMGLSFITRFQMGLCILGIFIWALTMNRYSFKICSVWIIGIFFSLIILLLCDFHVYDEWVFTPWSYFKSNLIEGVSSDFGVKPFYHYFHQLVLKLSPPIGLALILCLFISLFKRKFHLFNVVIWSLLVTHMVIPHKELRFIYPLIFLSPWLILEAYIFIRKWKYARLILIPIAVVNLFIIIPALAAPAGEGQIRMIRLLEEKNENKNKPLILNFTPKNNPLDPLGGLYANFYIESPVEYKEVDLLNDMGYKDKIFPGEFFVLSEKDFERLNAENWNVIDYNLQPWLHPFYRIYRGRKFRLLLLISPK